MSPRVNKAHGLSYAARCAPKHMPPGRNTQAQRDGLVYERKVISALADSFIASGLTFDLSHNPWFEYRGTYGSGLCVPDAMLSVQQGDYRDTIFVLEVKLTYVPEAIEKLIELYCPVVSKAFDLPAVPVVICKNMAPGAPKAMPTFFGAVAGAETDAFAFPLIHWLGSSRLPLGLPNMIQHVASVDRQLR